jgi:hypothetical protein
VPHLLEPALRVADGREDVEALAGVRTAAHAVLGGVDGDALGPLRRQLAVDHE